MSTVSGGTSAAESRLVWGLLTLLVGVGHAAPAHATPDETTAQCLDAYENGQRARKAGAFAKATAAFTFCGGPACPDALHGDCLRWLDEVERATPTSVFQLSNASGEPLHGGTLRIDGGPEQALDGRALAFDPGEHSLVVELEGYHPLETRFTFAEGEKLTQRKLTLQPLAVAAEPAAPAQAPRAPLTADHDPGAPSRLPIWIGAGVGLLGVGGFTYFTLAAREDDRALSSCYPSCPVARVDEVKQEYLNAKISLGVGAAGLVFAAAWLLFGPDDDTASSQSGGLVLYVGETTGFAGRF